MLNFLKTKGSIGKEKYKKTDKELGLDLLNIRNNELNKIDQELNTYFEEYKIELQKVKNEILDTYINYEISFASFDNTYIKYKKLIESSFLSITNYPEEFYLEIDKLKEKARSSLLIMQKILDNTKEEIKEELINQQKNEINTLFIETTNKIKSEEDLLKIKTRIKKEFVRKAKKYDLLDSQYTDNKIQELDEIIKKRDEDLVQISKVKEDLN